MKGRWHIWLWTAMATLLGIVSLEIILLRFARLPLWFSLMLAVIGGITIGINTGHQLQMSADIKAYVKQLKLTPKELAQMMSGKVSDYPMHNDQLQLIIPKRKRPILLEKLRKMSVNQKY